MSSILRARYFATAAHAAVGQKRKYSGDDYIVHPMRVSHIVEQFGGSESQIAAAWLHDVVEDTGIDITQITLMFSHDIAHIVDGLTDVSKPEDGNRAVRKTIDRQHSADAIEEAQFVKCADIIDNSSDISAMDPNFWKVYRAEMLLLLEAMTKVKDQPIWKQAMESVTQ